MEDSDLEREAGKELNCSGVHCFRKAFVMIKAATFLGFLVSIILMRRKKRFYKGDIYKKFREEAVVTEADGVVPSGETEDRAKVGANAGRYPHLHNDIQLNY